MTTKTYYKIAHPDGWDFYTGKTINYREALATGQPVRPPHADASLGLCSPGVLHASDDANKCFVGGRIPCSLYRIEGKAVVSDDEKSGFLELKVLEELDPATHFQWRYAEAVNPVHPFKLIPSNIDSDSEVMAILKQWASVRDSVRDSVWASVWAYIGYIFVPCIDEWKYIKHKPDEYPFQPAVDLWKRGLVPSFDGKLWRLHGGEDATILWEGKP